MAKAPRLSWHEEVIDASGLRAAPRLAEATRGRFYLAGGTALALRLGHRISLDLDLFSFADPLEYERREAIFSALRAGGPLSIREAKDGTCHLILGKTHASLFHYPYPLLAPCSERWRGLAVASFEDIAAMKLSAIIGRGMRKDFIDLYAIAQRIGLEKALNAGQAKFRAHRNFLLQASRALVYFDDAEKEPVPNLLKPADWGQIRRYFEREVPQWLKRTLKA